MSKSVPNVKPCNPHVDVCSSRVADTFNPMILQSRCHCHSHVWVKAAAIRIVSLRECNSVKEYLMIDPFQVIQGGKCVSF